MPPAQFPQLFCVLGVPPPVPFQLRRPVRRVALWYVPFTAVLVTVPEAAMHKDYRAPSREHDVRLSRQILPMQPEPEAHPVEYAPDPHLRQSVPGGNSCHDLGAPVFVVNVCHGSPCAHGEPLCSCAYSLDYCTVRRRFCNSIYFRCLQFRAFVLPLASGFEAGNVRSPLSTSPLVNRPCGSKRAKAGCPRLRQRRQGLPTIPPWLC